MRPKGSKEIEIAGCETGTIRDIVREHTNSALTTRQSYWQCESSDFHVLGPFRSHLADKRLAIDVDVKQAVTYNSLDVRELPGADKTVTNIGILFQRKTLVWFQELTKCPNKCIKLPQKDALNITFNEKGNNMVR